MKNQTKLPASADCRLNTMNVVERGDLLAKFERLLQSSTHRQAADELTADDTSPSKPEAEDFLLAIAARDSALRRLLEPHELSWLGRVCEATELSPEHIVSYALGIARLDLKQAVEKVHGKIPGETEAARNPDGKVQAT